MEEIDQIYDPVGENEVEDKQCMAAAVKCSANTQAQCHVSVQSKTEAEGYNLRFINDCSCVLKKKKHVVHFRMKLCSRSSQSSVMTGNTGFRHFGHRCHYGSVFHT